MKRYILLFIFCGLLISGLKAQVVEKVGYVNSDSLITLIPGRDTVQKVMEKLVNNYEDQLDAMTVKYEMLNQAFRLDSLFIAGDSGKDAVYEMLLLKKKIKDFKENAETELRSRQDEMLQALVATAEKAIAEVASENGYTFIIDSSKSNGMLLIFAGKDGDITPLVKKKLGVPLK